MRKFIILDRDGVINRDSREFIKSPEEWIPLPSSLEAIASLNQAGFTIVIASNQSGIGRGLFDLAMLESIHQKMRDELQKVHGHIEGIYFCPHTPEENCACRKPKTGLFTNIASDYNIDFKREKVPAIGDSLRDLEAAKSAGCEPILVLTGNGKETQKKLPEMLKDIQIFNTLKEAVDSLLMLDKEDPFHDIS